MKMKLVRVTHIRCGDYDCATFILAPDKWTEDEINKRVHVAQTKYQDEVRRIKAEDEEEKPIARSDFWYAPNFEKLAERYPNKTITEVREIIKEDKRAHEEWQKNQKYRKLRFANFLEEEGFSSIFDDDMCIETTLDWGHQHGTQLDYSEGSEVDTLPTPETIATGVVEEEF